MCYCFWIGRQIDQITGSGHFIVSRKGKVGSAARVWTSIVFLKLKGIKSNRFGGLCDVLFTTRLSTSQFFRIMRIGTNVRGRAYGR
jgi:hypothetical protein